jgi:hypothetical protein
MITLETAEKLRDLGFPLVSVGKEDHEYAAEFCRFCGFPFLKVGDTYYLMPVINAILGAFGTARVRLLRTDDGKKHYAGSGVKNDEAIYEFDSPDADEALCLLWIKLKEDNVLPA